MDTLLEQINSTGKVFINFAAPMLIQSSVLIIILIAIDFLLRNRIKAVFRYWLWMIVLIKLMLHPTLSMPTSPAYWFGQNINRPLYASVNMLPADDNYNTMSPYKNRYPQTNISTGGMISPFYFVNNDSVLHAQPKIQKISLSWQGSVFLCWLTFVVIMVMLLIQKTFFVKRLINQSQEADGKMKNTLKKASLQMGIRTKIALRISETVLSPSVCGLFKPIILIPKTLSEKINTIDLKAILLHELAHIKRYDLWVNLIQAILQIIYIYNPLLWIANIVIRNVREQAVDEMVLVAMGEQAEDYPKTLLNISKLSFGSAALSLRLIGVAESKKALFTRIKHITGRPFPTNAKLGLSGTLAIIIAAFIFLPMARAEKPVESDMGTNSTLYTGISNSTPSPYELIQQAQTGQNKPVEKTSSIEPAKTQQNKTMTGERTLHFPKDYSLGTYCIRMPSDDPGAGVPRSFMQNLEYLGEAQGDIRVPSNAQVTLSIDPTSTKVNLSGMDKLRPDDLYCVMSPPNPLNPLGVGTSVDNSIMPHIAHLTGLKALQLSFTEVNDVGMKYITALKSLEHLETSTQITDRGMAYVGQLPSLKFLWVYGPSQVTDAGLQHVSKLTSLEGLALVGDLMGDEGLANISNLHRLQFLHLEGPNFGDHGMIYLTKLKLLKKLNFTKGKCFISNDGLEQIAQIPNLEELNLETRGDPTDEGLAHLVKLRSLKRLKLTNLHLTDKGFSTLSKIKTLEHLELPGPDSITDTGESSFSSMSNLRSLVINKSRGAGDNYTDKSLESLSKCKFIEELTISSPDITDAGLAHLAKLTNLKNLNLTYCDNITNKGLANLAALKSLRVLYIYGGQITVSGINHLNSLTNLTRLDIYGYEPDGATLDLSGLTSLEKFRTHHQSKLGKYTDEDLKSFSGLKNLKWLHIYPHDFTDKGMSYLAGLTNIDMLIIGGKKISDEGLKYLANMKKLSLLNIDSSSISDKGLRYLEGLETLSTIEISSDNDFNDAALRSLMNKLPNLRTLKINGAILESVR
ncbi:MAG: leucine-rich repeat protein [Sedimentisphaerales bacterium]|nr:leucine-rich repeat protein [Sedimentisphaerales bacterium]